MTVRTGRPVPDRGETLMAEERDFEVIDRRRVARDAPPEAGAAPPGPAASEVREPEVAATGAPTSTGSGVAASAGEAAGNVDDRLDAEEGGDAEIPDAGPAWPTQVTDIVQICVGMLSEIAWVKLGLVPDPATGQLEASLDQARLAIDCAADLHRRLEPHLDGPTRRDLEVRIQNLKLNFVKRSG
jgi:hypothetical protein